MAFTQPSVVTNNISALNPEPNDVGGLTAPQLQALLDKFGVDFQTWFNTTHLAELASIVAGSSASERLGSAAIAGLTGNTVYTQLVSLLAVAQAAQAGVILPGTISDAMLSNLAGQIKDTMTNHLADYVKQVPYAVDAGTANTYAVTLSPAPTAYVDGMAVAVKIGNASTGASTLNVNVLGAKPILDSLGNAITSGGLKAGLIYSMRYNSTTGNFIVQGKGGGGNATAAQILSPYTATVDTGQVTGNIASKTAQTYTPVTTDQIIAAGQYLSGAQTVKGDANLIAANLPPWLTLFGITGTGTMKRYATGSQLTAAGSHEIVTGLSFQPRIIRVNVVGTWFTFDADKNTTTVYQDGATTTSSGSVTASGFDIICGTVGGGTSSTWYAWE